MKGDDIEKEKFICQVCGSPIKQSTAFKNDGLCTPCKKKKDATAGKGACDAPGAE